MCKIETVYKKQRYTKCVCVCVCCDLFVFKAFWSCWTELDDYNRDQLMLHLGMALNKQLKFVPPDVLNTLLDLFEFMDKQGKPLPLGVSKLGDVAWECHAYSKALFYKEKEFRSKSANTDQRTTDTLMQINSRLQQKEAAEGIVKIVQTHGPTNISPLWFETLQNWEDALDAYSLAQLEKGRNNRDMLGKLRCYNHLGMFFVKQKFFFIFIFIFILFYFCNVFFVFF